MISLMSASENEPNVTLKHTVPSAVNFQLLFRLIFLREIKTQRFEELSRRTCFTSENNPNQSGAFNLHPDQSNLFTREMSIEQETTERRRNGNKQRNFYLPKTREGREGGGGFPVKRQSHCLELGSHFPTGGAGVRRRGGEGGGGGVLVDASHRGERNHFNTVALITNENRRATRREQATATVSLPERRTRRCESAVASLIKRPRHYALSSRYNFSQKRRCNQQSP